jgi:hypothetical protein
MKKWIQLLILVVLIARLCAEPNANFPKVEDTSGAEANGERIIRLAVNVAASTNEVWQTFCTAEGWKSYAVAFAAVDMRIGGIIETSYKPDAKLGGPDNIKNQIVAYIPGRMLAIRCVQAPPDFKHKEEFFSTATILEIAPRAGGSRVTLTAVGYRPGEAYDDLFKHFRWGDAYTLDKLRERFETAATVAPKDTPVAPATDKKKQAD